jgi:predicted SAM-dependent methyltransferase
MNYIQRSKDIMYGPNELEHLYTFPEFPVFMGCTTQSRDLDQKARMSWHISPDSGMVQLNPLLPLDVVYAEEHGSGTVGQSWNEHHTAFAEFVTKHDIDTILEVGGLHGHLAKKSLEIKSELDWTIIEPNPRVSSDIKVTLIQGWFDDTFHTDKQYDAVVHSHVIEHLYDPQQFMKDKAAFMHEGSLLIFSVPNIKQMLQNKYTNCLNFEHTYYASEDFIIKMLQDHGFELVERKYFKQDHSIFFCAKKGNKLLETKSANVLYEESKSIFQEYITYHQELVDHLNSIIKNTKQPVYLFGAHIFSQYLLQFGLSENHITYILDNDLQKQEKRLYGTGLLVKSPTTIANINNPLVILRAGFYNEEIKSQITQLNPKTTFI